MADWTEIKRPHPVAVEIRTAVNHPARVNAFPNCHLDGFGYALVNTAEQKVLAPVLAHKLFKITIYGGIK